MFDDWRSLSKLIGTPGTGYRPPPHLAGCCEGIPSRSPIFDSSWSEVLNVTRMLYSCNWFARGPHEQCMNVQKQTVSPVTCVTSP
jgi:hypothetical protein